MNIRRLVKKMRKSDAITVDAVFQAALERKMELYPEWEIIYLALERENRESRKEIVRVMLEVIAAETEMQ